MPSFLKNKKLKLILFGGKGGSGKTTSATATALYLAETTEKKILIVSTDPAPSIGDSIDIEVGNRITQIRANLWAIEFNAKELAEDFKKENLEKIKTLVERGTYLEKEDIKLFEGLAIPGMDEVMAIIKIADLLKTKKYDLIILDTAPTGHTKVLLSLPEKMERWIEVMDIMQEKHRFLKRHWTGRYIKDEYDKFLENTRQDIIEVKNLLKNYDLTEFVPVTIPEPMSILETEALLEDLKRIGIKVESVIVNRVMTIEEKCPLCASRMKGQESYLKMIEEKFKDYQILKMPLFPTEIRGQDSLSEYAKILFGKKKLEIAFPKILPKFPKIPEGKMAEFLEKDLNFIICGGKGGVGKTSIAAATAIALAQKHKGKKILITTTDPAHALSNIFDQDIPIGGGAVPIKGFNNLDAIEIDAQKMQQKFNDESRQNIQEIFERFIGGGMDVVFDRKVMEELMDISPPGLDELMALRKVIELMKEGKYNFYVLDSAASGHLLRFLETPAIVRDWLKSIFQILLKYRGVIRLDKLKVRLLDLSKDVKRVQEILSGSQTTQFLMISIAEEMGIRQMGDLGQSLEKLNVFYHYIILNMILPVSLCRFCLTKREDQEKYISRVKKEYPKKEIVLIPLFPHDIRGIESLQKLSKFIFG
ncbi:MAG: ArsA family ATPase [bacterium]|nr:ArsA family ATPase [bacterium]